MIVPDSSIMKMFFTMFRDFDIMIFRGVLRAVALRFFYLSFTDADAGLVVFVGNGYAVGLGEGEKVADGIGHFRLVEVGTAAEVADGASVIIRVLHFEDPAGCYLLHVDVLGFVVCAAVLVGEVGADEVIVFVLGVATLGGIAFQFDVEALLLRLVDEVEGGEVVARV